MDSAKSTAKSAKVRVNTQHTEHTEHTELTQHTHTGFPQLRRFPGRVSTAPCLIHFHTHTRAPSMDGSGAVSQPRYV